MPTIFTLSKTYY